jgi:phytoene synthase
VPGYAAAVEYCRDLVRRHDRDRYVASLFVPDDLRAPLWGLYAFNHELAKIRDVVREPSAGELRLAWWREVIGAMGSDRAVDHPVVQVLARACVPHQWPQPALLDLIEARRLDLYDDPVSSLSELERYLDATSSALLRLVTRLLDHANAEPAAATAGVAGVAYGMIGILRSLPVHRLRNKCFIPIDVLARHDLAPKHFLAGEGGLRMFEALGELRLTALQRLGEARRLRPAVSSAAFPAFLPLALVEPCAARLARAGADALRIPTDVHPLTRLLRLWLAARSGRF